MITFPKLTKRILSNFHCSFSFKPTRKIVKEESSIQTDLSKTITPYKSFKHGISNSTKHGFMQNDLPFANILQFQIIEKFTRKQDIILIQEEPSSLIIKTFLVEMVNSIHETYKILPNEAKGFIFIEHERDAELILNSADKLKGISAYYVNDKNTFSSLMKAKHVNILIVNIATFIPPMGTIFSHEASYMILNVANTNALLHWFANVKVKLSQIRFYALFEQKAHGDAFKSITQRTCQVTTLTKEEKNQLQYDMLDYHFMCVTEETCWIALESLLTQYSNKSILLLVENKGEFNKIVDLSKTKNVSLALATNIGELKEDAKFDIVIQCPFINENEMLQARKHIRVVNGEGGLLISLFYKYHSKEIEEIRKVLPAIKVINLLSANYKTRNGNLVKQIEETLGNTQIPADMKKLYDRIQLNPHLVKKILLKHIETKKNNIIQDENETISVLTGERGYYTVEMEADSAKQQEDRYYLVKFALKAKLVTVKSCDEKMVRVINQFTYVIDVPFDRIEEVKTLGKQMGVDVRILNSLPMIFYNPLKEQLDIYKKF